MRVFLRTSKEANVIMKVRYAALPVRRSKNGRKEILLITTRKRRRWILPKGRPGGGKGYATAAKEAVEEAGVTGKIRKRSVGTYSYSKKTGRKRRKFLVEVFPLAVMRELKRWKEQAERDLIWLPAKRAAEKAHYKGLKAIIENVV
jgi:8-oxo-dGTP pyrophosphatase MutT (NUDIX family)